MCMETRNSKTEMPLFKVKDEKFIFAVQMKLQSKCRFVRKDGMRLLDLCDIKYGYAFDSKKFTDNPIYPPLVRIRDVKRGFSETFYAGEYSKEYLLHKGNLLIGMDGEFNIARWKSVDALLNQRVCKISAKKGINEEYIRFALSKKLKNIEDKTSFVTVKHLSARELSAIEFIMPEYEKQRKIADILVSIENIIEKKKQELEQLDTLVKSRFAEMFGDMALNQKHWDKVKIGSIVKSIESGWSGNGKQRKKRDGEIAVLKVSSVTKGYFIPEEYKVLDDQNNIKKYIFPQKGDLIFSRANTCEMVGATAIIRQDYPELILPDKLWKIQFLKYVDVVYIKYALSTSAIRKEFSNVSTGTSGSMYNVSMEKFKNIDILLPPIELQNQFADFVASIDKSKSKIQKSLEETQLLFDSLMQKYFG